MLGLKKQIFETIPKVQNYLETSRISKFIT